MKTIDVALRSLASRSLVLAAFALIGGAASAATTVRLPSNLMPGTSFLQDEVDPFSFYGHFDLGSLLKPPHGDAPTFRVVGASVNFGFTGLRGNAQNLGTVLGEYEMISETEFRRASTTTFNATQSVGLDLGSHRLNASAPVVDTRTVTGTTLDRVVAIPDPCPLCFTTDSFTTYSYYYTDNVRHDTGSGGAFGFDFDLHAKELALLSAGRPLDFSFVPLGEVRFDSAWLTVELVPFVVPEPGAGWLLGVGLLGLWAVRRRPAHA